MLLSNSLNDSTLLPALLGVAFLCRASTVNFKEASFSWKLSPTNTGSSTVNIAVGSSAPESTKVHRFGTI